MRKRGTGKKRKLLSQQRKLLSQPKCSICKGPIHPHKDKDGVVYWEHGHNAQPITNGRCCDTCNKDVVFPARINRLRHRRPIRSVIDQPSLFRGLE